jgi:hypothetical protein
MLHLHATVATGTVIAPPANSVADTAVSAADDSVHTAPGGGVCGGVGVKVAPFGGADTVSVTDSVIGGA